LFPVAGEVRFGKLIFAIGMYERQLKTLTPEFERDSRQYFDEAFGRAFHTGKTTQLRIVPVNKQIAVERGVATYDRIRAHIETSPEPFGMIGPAARWAEESGTGQAVTRGQMLDLLDQADRDGLVLQPENTKAPMFVCCCCGCCCGVLRSAKRLPQPADFFSSNFYAVADAEACESCGVCETRCQMDAVTSPEGKAVVDRSRCIGCALCLTTCPSGSPAAAVRRPPQRAA
jgi:electron transport complex protein RnfB